MIVIIYMVIIRLSSIIFNFFQKNAISLCWCGERRINDQTTAVSVDGVWDDRGVLCGRVRRDVPGVVVMSHPWYNTARWRRRRAHQLLVEPLCRMCAEQGRATVATVADHVEPHKGDYELFWRGKLQSLCAQCHSRSKQLQETRGYTAAAGVDGQPIDAGHPWNKKTGG